MSKLLPSRPDLSARSDPEPRLLTIDEDAADAVFEALASETARTMFAELQAEPATASALADATDTSVQNSRYHLERLQAADLVEAAGTQYSEKGREMTVYAPADEPLVMFASAGDTRSGLRAVLDRLVGAVAGVAVLSVLVHALVEGDVAYVDFTGAAGGAPEPGIPFATGVFVGGLLAAGLALAAWHWSAQLGAVRDWVLAAPALTGDDLEHSRRAVRYGALGAVGLAAVWLGVATFDVVLRPVGPHGPAQWLPIGLVLAAALQAYANDGLLVSWAVVFLPLLALGLASIGLGLAGESLAHLPGAIGYPVLLAVVGAAVLGSVGFALGVLARAAVGWLTPGTASAGG